MTREQMKLIENIKTIHEGITLFMVSSGVLDIMYNKIVNGSDPLILLDIDKAHLVTRKLLTENNPIERLEFIVNNAELSEKFTQIMKDIVESNIKMTDLLKQAGN